MDDMKAYLEDIAAMGRNGDTMLAHINPTEAAILKSLGGSGGVNPETGLPEFQFGDFLSGIGDLFGSIGSGVSDAASGVGNFVSGLFGGGGGGGVSPTDAFSLGTGVLGADAGGGLSQGAIDALSGGGGGISSVLPGVAGVDPSLGAVAGAAGGAGGGSGIGSWLSNNASWLLPAAGLGYAAIKSNQSVPYQGQIQNNAKALSNSATALTNPLLKGTPLPSGAQSAVDSAANAQAAGIRSTFANMGLSGSSMEAQALEAVQQQKSAQTFQDALALANQGFTNIGAANQAYGQLANAVLGQDAAFTNALASFMGSMGRTQGMNVVRAA